MGAWIETTYYRNRDQEQTVAPYMGAWIETNKFDNWRDNGLSHPTWVRGLKLVYLSKKLIYKSRTLHGCVD